MNNNLKQITNYLAEHTINDLTNPLHQLIETCFENVNESEKISYELISNQSLNFYFLNKKSRILFINDNKDEFIYQMTLINFVKLLRKAKIKEEIIKYFVLYFYGDYTLNNTGKIRLSEENVILLMKDKISLINKSFYESELTKEIYSLIFNNYDVIYFGDYKKGIAIKLETLLKANFKMNKFSSKKIKINNISASCKDRNISFINKYENYRNIISLKVRFSYENIINALIK